MAIIKEPSGIYPAFNDSFLVFDSELVDQTKAEITILPSSSFPKTFILYADPDGFYYFNFKEAAKVLLNIEGFKDENFDTGVWSKSISGLYVLMSVTIEVFTPITSEVTEKEYQFYKAVKQVGESIFSNPYQLLNFSQNGYDHNLTYFEGWPFHIDIQRVESAKKVSVKHQGTSIESMEMTATATDAFRINIDRSNGKNWTSENILPLIEGENILEILEDGVFKSNLVLKKRKPCSGVYLKWFNTEGGFSHWLFDEFTNEKINAKDVDYINSNEFLNVDSLNSNKISIGKAAERTLKIRTRANEKEAKELRSLFLSPFIQVYSSREANVEGQFLNIQVQQQYEVKNKKGNNEFVLTIEMPEVITAIL